MCNKASGFSSILRAHNINKEKKRVFSKNGS